MNLKFPFNSNFDLSDASETHSVHNTEQLSTNVEAN